MSSRESAVTTQAWSSSEGAAALAAPPLAGKNPGVDPRVLLGIFLPILIALAWEAAVAAGLAEGRLVPPPSTILVTLQALASTGELWTHGWATLWRVLAGFGLGAAAGIAFGALSGSFEALRRL